MRRLRVLSFVAAGVFGTIAFTPFILAVFLAAFGEAALQQSTVAAAVLGSIALIFLVVFFLFGVFVQSLVLCAVMSAEVSVLAVFRAVRQRYWRVMLFDTLAFLTALPGLLLILISMLGTTIRWEFATPGIAWVFLHALSLLRAPLFLQDHSAWRALMKSVRTVFDARSVLANALVILFAFVATGVYVSFVYAGFVAQETSGQLFLLALNTASILQGVVWFFPFYFLIGSDAVWARALTHLVNMGFWVLSLWVARWSVSHVQPHRVSVRKPTP